MSLDLLRIALWADVEIKPADRMVLAALADRADTRTGECWPSVAYLAAVTGWSVRSVQRSLDSLQQVTVAGAPLLERVPRSHNGRRLTDRYVLNLAEATIRKWDPLAREMIPEGGRQSGTPRQADTGGVTDRPKGGDSQSPDPDHRSRSETPTQKQGWPTLPRDVCETWERCMGKWPTVYILGQLLSFLRQTDDKIALMEEIEAAAQHGTKDLAVVERRVMDRAAGKSWTGSTSEKRKAAARQHEPLDGLSDEENAEADRLRKLHGGA